MPSTTISRVGRIGFGEGELEYLIEGTVSKGSPGSYHEPPDPGEVEVTTVYVTNAFGEQEELPYSAWPPFTAKEMEDIEQRLYESAGDQDYDEDPPDYSDDD